jgi:NAD(P)-dependent dehydrogenase (short-subunit alcohol dehydrogenase family)
MKRHSLDPVVLITGCSSGIGLSLARLLYERGGYRAVVTARAKSYEELTRQFPEKANFWVRELDVTKYEQIDILIHEIAVEWGGVDILVNNAGICYRSVMEHMDEDAEMQQLKTNYLGPLSLIRMVLPTMREKGYGHIINVSSVSGMMAMPTMGSYSASKHALDGASEALWYEMKPFGINISVIQPGFVHSNSFKNVYLSRKAKFSGELEGPYADYYTHISPFIEKLMAWSRSTPEKIAKKIYALMESRRPPLWKPATPDAILFGWLRKLLPKRVFHKIMFLMLPGSKRWGGQFLKTKHKRVS